MTWLMVGLGLAIVVVSLLGGVLPLATVLTHTRLQVYLSLAAGTMLGASFFHMLPEAVELGSPDVLRTAAIGLLTLFFLERFFSFHHHETGENDPHEGHNLAHGQSLNWGAAAVGLAVHTLISGVALASAASADLARGPTLGAGTIGVFLATLLHKPADALTIVSLMLRAGVSRPITHLVNFAFSLMVPVGMLLFWVGSHWLGEGGSVSLTAHALAFSAGTFLCIALSDLLPELQFHTHDRIKLSVALLAGFVLMGSTAAWEDTSHAHRGDSNGKPNQ